MAIVLADVTIDPPVILAPMAGITDLPFRRMVARFGAGLVVSEMVASSEVIADRRDHSARAALDVSGAQGAPTSVQIVGREPAPMAEAARIVTDLGAAVIDINMGCPARQVTGGASGAALMRDPDHALRLIEAVARATDRPVTLKCRLGWDEGCMTAPEIARRAEAAGVRMIAVHGRTRAMFYKGQADWAAIARVREAVTIPVVANGDILTAADARMAMAASGAEAVMAGRAAQGAPWVPAQIAAGLAGRAGPAAPEGGALAALVAEHHAEMLSFYGTDLGLRIARKHLGWYAARAFGGAGVAPDLRAALLTATEARALPGLIARAFTEPPPAPQRDAATERAAA
jgi:nifR3 family TIM-barrel protein